LLINVNKLNSVSLGTYGTIGVSGLRIQFGRKKQQADDRLSVQQPHGNDRQVLHLAIDQMGQPF
jgi:hypothetical protein